MATTTLRAAVYLRVSTEDQEPENQKRELAAFCERRGYEVAGLYVDRESGRKGRRERKAFGRLFRDAERRAFDVVVFWSLDRFSREGIRKTIAYLQQLEGLDVRFKSYTEPYLDTENDLVSHILLGVLSYFAEYEAKKISMRTKAGLKRARSDGMQLGRPSKFDEHRDELQKLVREMASKAEMARQTGLAYNTVKKYLRRLEADEGR